MFPDRLKINKTKELYDEIISINSTSYNSKVKSGYYVDAEVGPTSGYDHKFNWIPYAEYSPSLVKNSNSSIYIRWLFFVYRTSESSSLSLRIYINYTHALGIYFSFSVARIKFEINLQAPSKIRNYIENLLYRGLPF